MVPIAYGNVINDALLGQGNTGMVGVPESDDDWELWDISLTMDASVQESLMVHCLGARFGRARFDDVANLIYVMTQEFALFQFQCCLELLSQVRVCCTWSIFLLEISKIWQYHQNAPVWTVTCTRKI